MENHRVAHPWNYVFEYLKKRQLYVGMALASIGACYQYVVMDKLGWQFSRHLNFPHITAINYFAGYMQYLATFIFIIGVYVWFTEPTAGIETTET